jgi:hypothetical protein
MEEEYSFSKCLNVFKITKHKKLQCLLEKLILTNVSKLQKFMDINVNTIICEQGNLFTRLTKKIELISSYHHEGL